MGPEGYNGSNELLGRSVASKLWAHEPDTFFLEAAREISEKWNFFVNRSIPENFQRENFSWQVPTESLRTQDSENVYERWVQQQIFDPVLVARSWVSATKWGLLAKLCGARPPQHPFLSFITFFILRYTHW